ncbi:MAG: DUF190 domain-containing protein [Pseudomonadota bacterium]|nr:MAG: DUF190 domain-containing protein [Pseudomonadota bacterium]
MEIKGQAKLLRIFVAESHKLHHQPIYEVLVEKARASGMAGATALRGVLSFGASARIHTPKILDLAADMPMVVEIVDEEDKIDAFVANVDALFEAAGCGGLVTMERVEVIRYLPGARS